MRRGLVAWFTGLPASGKSMLAQRARERLASRGVPVVVLDSDAVRAALVPAPGYGAVHRDDFYATLARLAALLAHQGLAVLVAATAHRQRYRAEARRLAPAFLEVYVDCSTEECARRDTKGLYAMATAGRLSDLPGVGVAYERPTEPDVTAHGGQDEAALESVVRAVLAATALSADAADAPGRA